MPTPIPYVTKDQAATACGVTVRTINRWIARGHLRAHKLGPHHVRIALADLEALPRVIEPTDPAAKR